MVRESSKYPNFDETAHLPLHEIPLNYLTKADMSTLLRVLFRKKEGDKGYGTLPVAEMKKIWVERLCMRRILSVREYLLQEKEHHKDIVDSIIGDDTFPNTTIGGSETIPPPEANRITPGLRMLPLEVALRNPTHANGVCLDRNPNAEGEDDQARQDAMTAMMELASCGEDRAFL